MWWVKGCRLPSRHRFPGIQAVPSEVIAVYATTLDSRTGHAGGGPAPQPGTGTGDTRTLPVPRPRRPLDDVSQALDHAPEAPGTARHTAQSVLQAWQVDDEAIDALVLVVSELVTNAVEHARAPLALHLHRERAGCRVWVGVTDGGPAQAEGAWTASCADDEHGRGLAIVETLADAHGTRSHAGGTPTGHASPPETPSNTGPPHLTAKGAGPARPHPMDSGRTGNRAGSRTGVAGSRPFAVCGCSSQVGRQRRRASAAVISCDGPGSTVWLPPGAGSGTVCGRC